MEISLKELAKLSYLDVSAQGERTLLLQSLFDGQTWHQHVPEFDRMLVKLAIASAVHEGHQSE